MTHACKISAVMWKGTSKCCYYTVLHDDNGYGFDALEKLSYYLCHLYIRCTKSISVPSPIQYAHLAAYRARRHLASYLKDVGLQEGKDEESIIDRLSIEEVNKAITVKDDMKNTMYFT
ncbi:protein argonaute-4 [Trichonephila clavipes]|nr:protein argonaute-4 [Trichonephila clavipes]